MARVCVCVWKGWEEVVADHRLRAASGGLAWASIMRRRVYIRVYVLTCTYVQALRIGQDGVLS